MITSRNPLRGSDAVAEIRERSGSTAVEAMTLDLASFPSIRSFASDLLVRTDRLDVLLGGRTAEELIFGSDPQWAVAGYTPAPLRHAG